MEYEQLNDLKNYLIESYINSKAEFQISMRSEITSSTERITFACENFHF